MILLYPIILLFNFSCRLIKNNQLEIVTGGWVMTDEANAHYTSMITELVNGHQWIKENLNISVE